MMYSYSMTQWLLIFYFYCFFGWCFESTYVSLKKKRLVNRGFMRGPFLPLYGTGACMMLLVSAPFQDRLVLTFLAGCVGATILEYVTGFVMEALFKVRYWDYSAQKFNIHGYICLTSTLAWGGLTILMTTWIHHPVENILIQIPENITGVIVLLFTVYIAADFTLAFKAAIDLRDVLVGMEKAREELERLQKRLDVIVAVVNEEIAIKRQAGGKHIEELIQGIEESFEGIRNRIKAEGNDYQENLKEELWELRLKFRQNIENRIQLTSLKDSYKRKMLKGNPGMVSMRFKEALQELKESVERFKK